MPSAFQWKPKSLDGQAAPFRAVGKEKGWLPIIKHEASYPVEIFELILGELVYHPERNSTSILRADILYDSSTTDDAGTPLSLQSKSYDIEDYQVVRRVERLLLPRNPNIDKPLAQTCLFYRSSSAVAGDDFDQDPASLVIYLPHVERASDVPFYHPPVAGLGFLYTPASSTISLSLLLLPDTDTSTTDTTTPSLLPTRLTRTADALLRTIHKHSLGRQNGYQKRVHHDLLVPRSLFQDTYLTLKSRHAKHLFENWVERTDPKKHVFEDLGIAAFLGGLWTEIYGRGDVERAKGRVRFVDVGCGNGVLTHILLEEGWTGYGFDARRRKTWAVLGETAQANLREAILIPHLIPGADQVEGEGFEVEHGRWEGDTFIIGNHADELTPWIPLLASSTSAGCAWVVIPCCPHALSGAKHSTLKVGEGGRYHAYVDWIEDVATRAGWEVEREALRIPSTRNIALVGRRRRRGEFDVGEGGVERVIREEGGAGGFVESARKVGGSGVRGH
ncbi:tRNA(Ser) Um(44) 2'-O-methyltransferase [Saitoella coloradoensis]